MKYNQNRENEQFKLNDRLVEREVQQQQNQLVEFILSQSDEATTEPPFTWDDIENLDREMDETELKSNFPDEWWEYAENDDEDDAWNSANFQEDYDTFADFLTEWKSEEITEHQEVFTWYAVSSWMADRLADNNEPVIRTDTGQWWGRTTYGQLIAADGIITVIQRATEYGGINSYLPPASRAVVEGEQPEATAAKAPSS